MIAFKNKIVSKPPQPKDYWGRGLIIKVLVSWKVIELLIKCRIGTAIAGSNLRN